MPQQPERAQKKATSTFRDRFLAAVCDNRADGL
jgi:hypothetical protein